MKPQYMRPGLDFARGLAVEESGELTAALGDLQVALGKSIRWGWTSVNPELPPAKQESNASWVRRAAETVRNEITDVLNSLDRLDREMDNETNVRPNETPPMPPEDWERPRSDDIIRAAVKRGWDRVKLSVFGGGDVVVNTLTREVIAALLGATSGKLQQDVEPTTEEIANRMRHTYAATGDRWFRFAAERLEANPPSEASSGVEPVAWWDKEIGVIQDPRVAEQWRKAGYNVTPLYAFPPPSTAHTPPANNGWRPIETAPKDGTHILAYRVPIGIRFTINTNPPTVVHWFNDPEEPGFYTSVNEIAPEHPFNPTDWKPLDEPPTREEQR